MVNRQNLDLNPRFLQHFKSFTGHQRVRVEQGDHHFGDFSLNQRIAARRRTAKVGAGLKGDIGSRAHRRFALRRRITQRHDFSMCTADGLGVTLGYDFAGG